MEAPRIELLKEKKLAGKSRRMSFTNNTTIELWKSFMPGRNEIKNRVGSDYYSLEVYSSEYFKNFDPSAEFQKWAAVEVTGYNNLPAEIESLTVPEGLYAVFIHKGLPGEGVKTYTHIFREWLPHSGFVLDERPHFALMGEKYNKDSPDSEEEIWIPIRKK